ncbi:hypothetical protein Z950_3413 [Sulfitobacter mediterraneus KCTC 32188]|nr:hypothetical protein Z950_3413 [Sulfitobacter mediterraneus KCTC 32188]
MTPRRDLGLAAAEPNGPLCVWIEGCEALALHPFSFVMQ